MPSAWFNRSKSKGRWFEWLLRCVLPGLGFEVIDTDGWKYGSKRGVDIQVKLKNPDGSYRRNELGYIIQENLEAKYDEASGTTNNVYVEFDALDDSISSIWFYGLPRATDGRMFIDVYVMFLKDLAPFAYKWRDDHRDKEKKGGEWKTKGVAPPKEIFISQPWIKKFKTIEITKDNSYQTWLSMQRVAA